MVNSRDEIVKHLKSIRHGTTPAALLRSLEWKEPQELLARDLVELELDRLITIHRDSSAGRRMGGLNLPDGTSCTFVSLRHAP